MQTDSGIVVEGIAADLLLPDLSHPQSAPKQPLQFKRAALGELAVTNGRIEYQIETPTAVFIEKMKKTPKNSKMGVDGRFFEKIDCFFKISFNGTQIRFELGGTGDGFEINRQLFFDFFFESTFPENLITGFQKKIEWIEDCHFGNQTDLYFKLFDFLRKNNSSQVIVVWVLLPIDEVIFRGDP